MHNAEFTLIEWYRLGYTLDQLMFETETLVRTLLAEVAFELTSETLSLSGFQEDTSPRSTQ